MSREKFFIIQNIIISFTLITLGLLGSNCEIQGECLDKNGPKDCQAIEIIPRIFN